MNRFQNPLTPEKVLIKAQKFCLYRERSEAEMERKMKEWGAAPLVVDDILDQLIEDRFVSNKRFSEAYTRGKFNIKRWGKVKIRQGLKMHKISEDLIAQAFLQISSDEYVATLKKIIQKKMPESIEEWSRQERYELKGTLFRTAAQKGYESDLIFSVLNQIFKE